jgi:hypothetical protein
MVQIQILVQSYMTGAAVHGDSARTAPASTPDARNTLVAYLCVCSLAVPLLEVPTSVTTQQFDSSHCMNTIRVATVEARPLTLRHLGSGERVPGITSTFFWPVNAYLC